MTANSTWMMMNDDTYVNSAQQESRRMRSTTTTMITWKTRCCQSKNAYVDNRSPKSGDVTRCVTVVEDTLGFPQVCMDNEHQFVDKTML